MAVIVLIYAILILVGGIIGHAKAASLASLISGIVFGLLLLGCAIALFAKKRWGVYASLVVTFVLDGFFTYRFLKTHVFMPAGLLSLISLVVLIYLAKSITKMPRT